MRASVEQGNVYAEYALAMAYLNGKIVPKDDLKALELLRHASSQDNQFAQYQLGKMMLQGEETPKDVATAVHWLTVSAMHGNQYAQYALGKLYLLGKSSVLDLNASITEKDTARRSYITALYNYWSLYYTLRSITLYDFEKERPHGRRLGKVTNEESIQ